jgi:uncharacterized protein
MANPVRWFEVAAKDPDAIKSFYAELFDWKFDDLPGDMPYSTVEAADGGIPGGIGGTPEDYPGHVTFYVAVDDLEAALSKVESLGGSRMMGPMDIPNGQIALFNDPEGHTIGLMHMNDS